MPGCWLHLLLASHLLKDEKDQDCRAAFLTGALAPDMGYFPGGFRELSDLIHQQHSGSLTRSLFSAAECPITRSFALGWASHVLADALIHPLINRATGEFVHGPGAESLSPIEAPIAHFQVEQGLDSIISREPCQAWQRPCSKSSRKIISLLQSELSSIYGTVVTDSRVHRSWWAMCYFAPLVLGYAKQLNPKSSDGDPACWLARIWKHGFKLARFLTYFFPRWLPHAIVRPHQPSNWLIDETRLRIDEFANRFNTELLHDFTLLPEYNLDTGQIVSEARGYEK